MDKWTDYLEDGGKYTQQIDVMYSDFEKAFDKVPRKRLISKLRSYGFDNIIIMRVQDFLRSQKFRVRVNSSYSAWDDVNSCIPQGSVLGPSLFHYFIYISLMLRFTYLLTMRSYFVAVITVSYRQQLTVGNTGVKNGY